MFRAELCLNGNAGASNPRTMAQSETSTWGFDTLARTAYTLFLVTPRLFCSVALSRGQLRGSRAALGINAVCLGLVQPEQSYSRATVEPQSSHSRATASFKPGRPKSGDSALQCSAQSLQARPPEEW